MLYRSDHLSNVSIPTVREEQDRSLLRARHFMKRQEVRLKQVIMKYLQVSGYRYTKKTLWTQEYVRWVKALEIDSTPRYVLDLYLSELEVVQQT